ncbi:hypothetical protein GQ55_3G041600 [Panicum hallii var. hallii]|uniref:GATA-type domain-containing protein n=1 Tax=Panicum hallii var. hallii TaxID=1504633 RepID=A0A2T7E5L1_9POAL|nr:hypothetical protein GQ55_3G041600 [Panicum hallii var. hallii]
MGGTLPTPSISRRRQQETPVSDEPQPQPPGSGPSRSLPSAVPGAAACDMAGSGGAEGERDGRHAYDAPAWTLLLAAVSRKKRSRRGPASSRSWAFRRPVPVPPPLEAKKPMARKATRAGRCVDCGATETPQWRAGPTGPGTLCNSCGVRRRAAGERWGERRRPRRATARSVSDQQPLQESRPIPDPESPPDSQICEQELAPAPKLVLVTSPPPATESLPALGMARTDPDFDQPSKNKKKPPAKTNEDKLCDHCASSSTPKWREGPKGPRTLCNACGVRYSQGRLLPEYRPQVSPTFKCREHASLHSEELELRRQRKDKQQQPDHLDLASELRVGDIDDNSGVAAANPTDERRR